MSQGQEVTSQSSAAATGASLVQNGWHVIAADGEDLGQVVRMEGDRMVIDRAGLITPGHVIIPRHVIDDEDEASMEVFLTIDSAAADQFAGGSK